MSNPVLVEVWRGRDVESRHRGSVAVVDASGAVVAAWGDTMSPVYPRSAVKPLQALVLVESGAADRFAVSDAELALACASHNAEPEHVEAVRAWLARLWLGEGDLECGAHAPLGLDAAAAMTRAGVAPSRLHNNCSGKHAGMLASALALGAPTRGYAQPDHPVQARARRVLAEMAEVDLGRAPVATDGCGVPTWGLPLRGLALAFARMARPDGLDAARAAAIARIRRAVARHPRMVAGTGRFCTEIMAAAGEAILIKTGAEGVFAAALPGPGLGLALKIDDGAQRASECAIASLLGAFAESGAAAGPVLRRHIERPLANWAGDPVGAVRAAPGWPG